MDLDELHNELAALNRAFLRACGGPLGLGDRLKLGEALLLDV